MYIGWVLPNRDCQIYKYNLICFPSNYPIHITLLHVAVHANHPKYWDNFQISKSENYQVAWNWQDTHFLISSCFKIHIYMKVLLTYILLSFKYYTITDMISLRSWLVLIHNFNHPISTTCVKMTPIIPFVHLISLFYYKLFLNLDTVEEAWFVSDHNAYKGVAG